MKAFDAKSRGSTWAQKMIPLLSRHFSEKTHMGAKKDPSPVTPSKLHFSEKTQDVDAKRIIILCQWGYTGMKIYFYENIFSFRYQWGYTRMKT